MSKSSQQQQYNSLRIRHPEFIYHSFTCDIIGLEIVNRFHFSFADDHHFYPQITIPFRSEWNEDVINTQEYQDLVFHIGMVELISYWKSACSPLVTIRCGSLKQDQIDWFKKLYFNGLGEFFYRNNIRIASDDFMEIVCDSSIERNAKNSTNPSMHEKTILVPIGGGKDSVVSIEVLKKSGFKLIPFSVNPLPAVKRSIKQAGFNQEDAIFIKRTIDQKLLELNALGYLNGHTPFSALLAFVSFLTAWLNGVKYIALSNESSASEPNIDGVNHQYSKSVEFEYDFRQYSEKYLPYGPQYFSFLRPLNELQIASLFAGFTDHHYTFRSCNVGSKRDIWCAKCSKCLFTYIMLGPFLPLSKMKEIYGGDLLDDADLKNDLEQLTGIQRVKPFDCVGTRDEVKAALHEIYRQRQQNGEKIPLLLDHFRSHFHERENSFNELMNELNEDHHVSEDLFGLLNAKFGWR